MQTFGSNTDPIVLDSDSEGSNAGQIPPPLAQAVSATAAPVRRSGWVTEATVAGPSRSTSADQDRAKRNSSSEDKGKSKGKAKRRSSGSASVAAPRSRGDHRREAARCDVITISDDEDDHLPSLPKLKPQSWRSGEASSSKPSSSARLASQTPMTTNSPRKAKQPIKFETLDIQPIQISGPGGNRLSAPAAPRHILEISPDPLEDPSGMAGPSNRPMGSKQQAGKSDVLNLSGKGDEVDDTGRRAGSANPSKREPSPKADDFLESVPGPSRPGKRVRRHIMRSDGSADTALDPSSSRALLRPSDADLAPRRASLASSTSDRPPRSAGGSSRAETDDPLDIISGIDTPDPLDTISRDVMSPALGFGGPDSDRLDSDLDILNSPPGSANNDDLSEMLFDQPLSASMPHALKTATSREVEEVLANATQAVDIVDLDASTVGAGAVPRAELSRKSSSSDSGALSIPPRAIGTAAVRVRDRFEQMTRAEKRAFIENDGRDDESADEALEKQGSDRSSDPPSSSVDGVDFTISATYPLAPHPALCAPHPVSAPISIASTPEPELDPDTIPGPEHPPAAYRGSVRRHFETKMIDEYNALKPRLTNNPALHRAMFQDWMSEATAADEPHASEIGVVNDMRGKNEGGAPDMEFQYGNDMLYHPDVPDRDTGMGCGCEGPCKPDDRSCRCQRRQELYSYATLVKGFAYEENRRVKNLSLPIWECGPNCGCPPSCMNRVIQRGRDARTQIEIFKTRLKGWGVRARSHIPQGTFLGIYSGELIPDYESERRGHLYTQIGRTYLFDCDGWQIRNPPDLDRLRRVDPHLADLAEQSVKRFRAVAERAGEAEMSYYSAYSGFFFLEQNFTRYFNHSCDPNLSITQAYVGDFHPERPKLVIFTRRHIEAGQEMCISYSGVPDDDDDDDDSPPTIVEAKPVKAKGKRGSRQAKNKTSANAHVASEILESGGSKKATCKCGARNCKGTMFAIEAVDS